jgi:hypothetical protein
LVLTYFTLSTCFLSFFKFSYLAKVHIAQNQNTHTHTLSPDTKTMADIAAFGATKTPPLHQFFANFNIREGRIQKKYLFGCTTKVHRTSARGFFIQRRNSPQRSIMLRGNSDNCGNYDNDGCGVQNVSGDEDGDDDDDNADDDNEDGSGDDVGGVDGVGDRGDDDDNNNDEDNYDGGNTTIKWCTDWRRDNNGDSDVDNVRNNNGSGDEGGSVDGGRQLKR